MASNLRVLIDRYGPPEVLRLIEEPPPEPKPGQVRVRILAAGVGYSDVMAQRGGYPLAPRRPFTPGYDFAGVVDALGAGVSDFAVGQTVAGLNPAFGGYAHYLCVPASILVPFPSGLNPVDVASLVLNYLTAHCMLHKKARVQPGASVLVHSAAGGVGSALIQLCVPLGVHVFGTASCGKHELVRRLGATPIDYKSEDFVSTVHNALPNGVDAAFDAVGGEHLRRSYRAVRRGGRVICYGFAGHRFGGLLPMAAGVAQMAALNLIPDGKRVLLCATPAETRKHPDWYRRTLAELIGQLTDGTIQPVIGATFPLQSIREAHALMESGQAVGKVVLQMN